MYEVLSTTRKKITLTHVCDSYIRFIHVQHISKLIHGFISFLQREVLALVIMVYTREGYKPTKHYGR